MGPPLVAQPLVGRSVRLDPTTVKDAPELLTAAGSPDTFRWFSKGPEPFDTVGMAGHIERLLGKPDVEPLTLRQVDSGRVIGMTSYLEIRPNHRGLEIGWTFIAPDQRGTRANPEMKRLLLAHAFETEVFGAGGFHSGGPALRVALKTHHQNLESQRAIERLGATREGVLRNHIIMPDDSIRHTVMYSITPEQWPEVRAGLDRRLG